MPTVKTAISVREDLYRQIDRTARELNISRSRLFVLAAEDFILRRRNEKVLEDLNEAYRDAPNETERSLSEDMKRTQAKLLEADRW